MPLYVCVENHDLVVTLKEMKVFSFSLGRKSTKEIAHYKTMNNVSSFFIEQLGAYSDSRGVPGIRKEVAEFIERRDGYPR